MDLNDDSRPDVLSGSWPGEIYLFLHMPDGSFAAGVPIQDMDGKPIDVGDASAAHASDWNGDGLIDLLIGTLDGEVHLIVNHGTHAHAEFGSGTRLEAGGAPVRVALDAAPTVADWDHDGKDDLIVGGHSGRVVWYRNAGTRRKPKLTAARVLVDPRALSEIGYGALAKVHAVDWNADGWSDLIVGDHVSEVVVRNDDGTIKREGRGRLWLFLRKNSLPSSLDRPQND